MSDRSENSDWQDTPEPVNLYEQVFSSFHTGVIVVNQEDIIVVANPAACYHLNVKEEELHPGIDIKNLTITTEFAEILDELKNTNQPVLRREIILEHESNKQIIGATASELSAGDGYNGAILVFTNLTETRDDERAAAINRQLAQIGKLTGGVVHELRNPLSVISGMAELLKRKLGSEHELHSFASMIFDEAQGMEKLVAKFLSFAKPFELEFGQCTAQKIVDRACEMNSGLLEAKEINLQIKSDETCSEFIFRADMDKTALALSNLLNNAIEAVEKNGEIKIACFLKDESIHFKVTDNGSGIHNMDRESLANPFYSRKAESTGLGLSIANRIVTAHGGYLNYGNKEDGGAWFEFTIPIEVPFMLKDTNDTTLI